MRITANSFSNSLMDELNRLSNRQFELQTQISTGRRVQNPDDDPSAMRRVMDLQAEGQSLSQYRSNIASLQGQATAGYQAIHSLKTISDRIGEISILADGTKAPAELRDYGTEVTQLIQEAVQSANSQFNGSYLFAGTLTTQPPFEVTTDAVGLVTGVTYHGNESVSQVEIDQGVTLAVLSPGVATSGGGPHGLLADSRTSADFFAHLISFQNHLMSGDAQAIAAIDRPALARDEDNLLWNLSFNASHQARLEAADSMAVHRAAAIHGMVSSDADADMAQTIMQLSQTQNAYQAAIQSGATIMSHSLLDYLT
jgi:flagellar hook-associated protein 3 FlgL